MNEIRIFLAAFTGTTAMTTFSYQAARLEKEQFREPELLGILLKRLFPDMKYPLNNIGGWMLHYSVGILFTVAYDKLWRGGKMKPSVANGALVGAASGLIGIGTWHTLLYLHPDPPRVNLKRYYPHLLAAHVVFGVFSSFGYRLPANSIHSPKEPGKSFHRHHVKVRRYG